MKAKKITAWSIAIMLIGGTNGAGIFFKNRTLSRMAQGDLAIVLGTWAIGIIAMLALGIAIIEVSSAQKSNRGSLEWVKLFCPKWFYRSSSFYIRIIYLPIMLFTFSLYLTNALEDAGLDLKQSEILALLFAFGVFMWFMLVNLISLRFVEKLQWLFTLIQTVPLVVFPIIGFINAGQEIDGTIWNKSVEPLPGLTGASPWLGTIAGISAIAFAYDGFYNYASLRNEMVEPRKNGLGLTFGVIGVSSLYLFLTLGVNMAGNGAADGLAPLMSVGVYKMLNGFIGVAIMGVLNNYVMSSIRQFKDINLSNEAPEIKWLQKLIYRSHDQKNKERQSFMASWSWILLSTTFLFCILGPVGAFAYNLSTYGDSYAGAHLYSLADVITNFTSLLVFIIIAGAVVGCLINRKLKKIEVEKNKLFIPCALISTLILAIGVLYMVIETIVGTTGYNGADQQSNIINLVIFLTLISLSLIAGFFDRIRLKITKKQTSKHS